MRGKKALFPVAAPAILLWPWFVAPRAEPSAASLQSGGTITRVSVASNGTQGDGPLMQELIALKEARGLDDVHFEGHVAGEHLNALLQGAASLEMPSEWYENRPCSVMEALAAGKPVVAARIGGVPELVREGETGLLLKPGNTQELAQ